MASAYLDYMTLTSWTCYERVVRDVAGIRYEDYSPRVDRRSGYNGKKYGNYWYGSGFQKRYGATFKEPHYMFIASGASADSVRGTELMYYDWKCTRLDIQVTLPSERTGRALYDIRECFDVTRKYTLVESSEGGETLYIGSRKSESFWRYYKKQELGDDVYRLEVECKGKKAENYFLWLQAGGVPKDLYLTEFIKLPSFLQRRLSSFIMNLEGNRVLPNILESYGLDRALSYLNTVVKPFLGNAYAKLGLNDRALFANEVEQVIEQLAMFQEE